MHRITAVEDVARDGTPLTGTRARDLVRLLVLSPAGALPTTALVDGLWPDGQRPAHPAKAVQVVVSRVRAQWGPDAITTTADGYRLADADDVDVRRARADADDAEAALRQGRADVALRAADRVLLIRADGDVTGAAGSSTDPSTDASPAADVAVTVVAAHRRAARARAVALADLGRWPEAFPELEHAAAEAPDDEAVLARLLRAEAAVAGPTAALTRFEQYRRRLRDTLGTDPGPDLAAVHADLLAGQSARSAPATATALVGREEAIDAVVALTRSSRVTTIVGPGGLGKTTLALAVADRLTAATVIYVELVTVTAAEDLDAWLAGQLGGAGRSTVTSGPRPSLTPRQVTLDRLRDSRAVLVLDNCEQIVDAVADLTAAIVATCRRVTVLATSRAPLRISAEAVFAPRQLTLAESVDLFTRRARAVRPDADLAVDAVAAVCERLDGLPLAIELAASRVRTLTVTDIAARLTDRFALLRGRDRDRPDRHRTLEAVIAWSWDLLTEPERNALAALTAFPDAFTPAAAAAVVGPVMGRVVGSGIGSGRGTGAGTAADVEDMLDVLVDQSLLTVLEAGRTSHVAVLPVPGVRYRLLETVREFAAPRQRDPAAVRDGLIAWAAARCRADRRPLHGPEQPVALARIAADAENLARALRLALDDGDPRALDIAATVGMAWGLMDDEATLTAIAEPLGELARREADRLVRAGAPSRTDRADDAFAATADTLSVLIVYTRDSPESTDSTRAARARARNIRALRALLAAQEDEQGDEPCDYAEPDQVLALRALARRFPALIRTVTRGEPLVAGPGAGTTERAVTVFLSAFITENQGRIADAIADLTALVPALEDVTPWLRAGVYLRIGELYLGRADGENARRWVEPELPLIGSLGSAENLIQAHAICLMAAMARGDLADARAHLAVVERIPPQRSAGAGPFRLVAAASAAEIAAVEGRVDDADRLLRELAVDAREQDAFFASVDRPNVWYGSALALDLAILARHQRPLTGDDVVAEASGWLLSVSRSALPFLDRPQYGALVFALASWLLAAGRTRDEATASSRAGARLLAVALSLDYNRTYPSMSLAPALALAREDAGEAFDAATAELARVQDDALLDRCREILAEILAPPATEAGGDGAQVRRR
ncbi:BTAD domain-containing putative transcriptional regulator [Tersicoccus sp. Bi-70]|uniref:ATP-binding protein n=1 Tax=Tersicoccus sp. Bi-70 TaxID=1897634 RepID=UPI001301684D|nr:BTAD domain-containing putative transcriptional regulator [Tersicoccus sp. Bi-70]